MTKILDNGFVELIDFMGDDNAIVTAARVSYLGESKGAEQDEKLLEYLMRNRHTTPFEMVQFKFKVKCPIFIARQWMRHRTFSYNEVSRRYTSENIDFFIPSAWRTQDNKNKQGSSVSFEDAELNNEFNQHIENSINLYNKLIEKGVAREQARMVLPQNMYTTFIMSCNLHNLLHFIRLRSDSHAQYEIKLYADCLLEYVKEKTPLAHKYYLKYINKN